MRNDWIFDAVQAEVAYRTEELHKAGRVSRVVRGTLPRHWAFARRWAEVTVPEQRRAERDEAVAEQAGTR